LALHDPIAPLEVVATNEMFRDPALADLSEAELDEYRKDRDLAALQDRLQCAPTAFVVQRLPPTAAMSLDGMTLNLRLFSAFVMGCHEVRLPDGAVLKPEPKKMRPGANGTKLADDEWFNAVSDRFGLETCYEIGRVAHQWARLPRAAHGPFIY
jgi:hypothetical protein